MAEARRTGGKRRRKAPAAGSAPPPAPSEKPPPWSALATLADVRAGYAWALRAVMGGRLDARTANAVGGLLGGAVRAIEAARAQVPGVEGTPATDGPRIYLPAESTDEDDVP